MKRIFTLIAGLFLTVAAFAADRRPMVTINSEKNFKVVIDGRSYFGSDAAIRISNLSQGTHSIRVYEMKRNLFDRREKLVSSTTFKMGKKDVRIFIDHSGRVTVAKTKGRYSKNGKSEVRINDFRIEKEPRF